MIILNLQKLENHYEILEYRLLTGKDKITKSKFSSEKIKHFDIALRKYNNGTYSFTNYKKMKTKNNRVVNIATIRDRIMLNILKDTLQNKYNITYKNRNFEIERLIDILKEHIPLTIIRLDITDFFDSINKSLLFSKLKNNSLLGNRDYILLYKSLKQFTTGVGQGLPISNALAEIYLENIDWQLKRLTQNIAFYSRFVDDILIVLNGHSSDTKIKELKVKIYDIFTKYKLQLNSEKSILCNLSTKNSFNYLGYKFLRNENTDTNINLNIGITQKKYNKECKKILRTFEEFSKNNDFSLLEERLSILTRKNYINKSNPKVSNDKIEDTNKIICFGFIENYKHITNLDYLKNLDRFIAKNLYKYIADKKQRRSLFKYSYYVNFKNNNYNNFVSFELSDFIDKMATFESLFPYTDYDEFLDSFSHYETLDLQRYYFSRILSIYKNC